MRTDITGVSGSRTAYYTAKQVEKHKKILIVVSSEREAMRLKEDMAFFIENEIIVLPEEEERIIYEARDKESLGKRIKAMHAFMYNQEALIIAPVSSVLRRTENPERFRKSTLFLKTGDIMNPQELKRQLVLSGFVISDVAEASGEFSARGDIIDIFPPGNENPIRIEFFDDEIDSIRYYDKISQRSIKNIGETVIFPAAEFIPSDHEIKIALKHINQKFQHKLKELDKDSIDKENNIEINKLYEIKDYIENMFEEKRSMQIYSEFPEYFDDMNFHLWDYSDNIVTLVIDPVQIIDKIPSNIKKETFYEIYKTDNIIYTPFPEKIKGAPKPDEIINTHGRQIAAFNGQINIFLKELLEFLKTGYTVTISSETSEGIKNIREYIEEAEIHGRIYYKKGYLSAGMVIDDEKLCYITEQDVFPKIKRKNPGKKKKKKNHIEFSDLNKGDFIVHESFGIGKFEGIKTLKADGDVRDYLKIHYAGTEVLYIPVDQMDIVQKYIGNEGNAPRLSKLSTGEWSRTREKAKKAVMKIAEDLVKLYAEREKTKGFAFSKDTVWQTEFEEDFPYEETDDQLRAIEEIKQDMEKPIPMDRLLCGDVGYGKTEVAARAIFKCLAEGKQAVMLAPTTLLVNQHYNTLKRRFEKFPFYIEMLSRFRNESEQQEIIGKVKSGKIDFIVGTHRLLSKDIKFKDLGLLVIDEEQKFGVRHKEKIKEMRKNVDVLTLSATPIPRTLNMSLTGIKNISIIEEPPENRYPVQTFVTQEDKSIIKHAIEKELNRGGQAYVVYNRVKGIRKIAEMIEELIPQSVVEIGHGQMDEKNLENVMIDFTKGKCNVLVSTTIIENGIDISNANTIIILNADTLGLSQLYQLRGRVGRSNRPAYAYLMYRQSLTLSDTARKRLAAIREFTEFGSGFKLAMRDLEIRGAGNILGEAQSGHIEGIGYELYCKEIDRAVRSLKGEKITETRADIKINLNTMARIPENYVKNEVLKLQAYKKIALIDSQEDADDVINELFDRYGDIPQETFNLISVSEIRSYAEKIGISEILENDGKIMISFGEVNTLSPYSLVMAKDYFGERLIITSGKILKLTFYVKNGDVLNELLKLMRFLIENIERDQA